MNKEQCNKKIYSKKEAATALNHNKSAKTFRKKRPVRYYYCRYCDGWHLTSMKRFDYED